MPKLNPLHKRTMEVFALGCHEVVSEQRRDCAGSLNSLSPVNLPDDSELVIPLDESNGWGVLSIVHALSGTCVDKVHDTDGGIRQLDLFQFLDDTLPRLDTRPYRMNRSNSAFIIRAHLSLRGGSCHVVRGFTYTA